MILQIFSYWLKNEHVIEYLLPNLIITLVVKSNPEVEKAIPYMNSDYSEYLVKRFSGYWARHYRVQLKDNLLQDTQKRYVNSKTEIQVASVLMHAWSEVEHDLVYVNI